MRVSVLIPVYNKAPFAKEAVESVLNGTFRDIEVVCVDDKSTDNSLAVLRSIADPRVRIIELQENLGPAGAANAGLDTCRGDYVVRLDADDIAVPDRLEKQVSFMDARPDIGASGGRLDLFGATSTAWTFPLDPDDCAAQLLFGVPVSQGASIMRRSVLEEHGLRYDPAWPRFGEDWLFWARMARVARFANIPDTVALYRRGEQNISHGRDRIADYSFLAHAILTSFGIPHDEDDMAAHLMGLFLFKERPSRVGVRKLRDWHARLLAWNADHGAFPREAFKRRIERSWNGLYFYLPRYGSAPALEHLRLSGAWPKDRLAYLAKYRVNALLGRTTNG